MRKSGSRVLAGLVSLAVGGVFVTASAMGAMADSPAPASLVPTLSGNTLSLSGTLVWGGKCPVDKAGFGIVWNDTGDVGYPLPGDATKLVGLSGSPGGETDNNLVHAASCSGSTIVFGPISHTYVGPLPSSVCAVGYDYRAGQTGSAFHSQYEGNAPGQLGNSDNSVTEPVKGGQQLVCTTVVKKQPDVTISNNGTPATVNAGDNVTYHIVVSNLQNAAAATGQTQLLTDTLDANESFVSVTPGAGWTNCSNTAKTVTCSYPAVLNPGQAAPAVTVVTKALDNGESSLTNTAHVDNGAGNPDDANPNNQTAMASTAVVTPQDIAVHKSATPRVNVGEDITYKVHVTNTGKNATKDTITVSDSLPNSVSYKSASGPNWSCAGGANLNCTWTGGNLASNASTSDITIIATALQGAVPHVTNTAHAHMGTVNVQDDATTDVGTPVNLTLTKSADPASGSDVSRGEQINYTLHYANTGTTPANNVTITDEFPAGTSYKAGSAACTTTCTPSVSGNAVSFSLDLPANSSGNATFAVIVDDDAVDASVIDNVAEITYNGQKVPSNHTKHYVFVPKGDLNLHKSVSPTEATVGTVLTYTLKASASGNIDQTGVVVADAIPDGTSYKAGSADCDSPCTASYDASTDSVTWKVGTLHPGDKVALTFKVTVDGPASDGTLPTEIVNVGQISSNETPAEPSNRVVTKITFVLGEKVVKAPPTTTLPFTGFDTMQNALFALVLVGAGLLLLTWPRLQPAARRVA